MAGLGEACSHIAALLFALEANNSLLKNESCTSQLCSWLPAGSQCVKYVKISDIDFTTPATKRQRINMECTSSRRNTAKQKPITPKPSESELTSFYTEISMAGKPALLSIVPNFCKEYIPRSVKDVLPFLLTDMFDQQMLVANYMDLLMKCEEAFNNLAVTGEQAQALEKATRGQKPF